MTTRKDNAKWREMLKPLILVERESEILKGTLSDIKSDVSFIRGKMEAQK